MNESLKPPCTSEWSVSWREKYFPTQWQMQQDYCCNYLQNKLKKPLFWNGYSWFIRVIHPINMQKLQKYSEIIGSTHQCPSNWKTPRPCELHRKNNQPIIVAPGTNHLESKTKRTTEREREKNIVLWLWLKVSSFNHAVQPNSSWILAALLPLFFLLLCFNRLDNKLPHESLKQSGLSLNHWICLFIFLPFENYVEALLNVFVFQSKHLYNSCSEWPSFSKTFSAWCRHGQMII